MEINEEVKVTNLQVIFRERLKVFMVHQLTDNIYNIKNLFNIYINI